MMLPNGWKEVKLGDICDKIGSGSTPKGGREVYLNAGIPIIRSQNVLNGFLDLSDVAFISDEQHGKMKGTWVRPNDILLNITGASIGRSCVVPADLETANVNQHVCIIRLKECADACYVCNLILSKDVQKQIELLSVGGGRQGLNFQQIASFSFALPPLEEQKKIAETLSVWEKAIEKTEKLIEAKETQKKSLIWKLIESDCDKKYKLSNVVIDKNKWNKCKLSDIASGFDYGMNAAAKEYDGKNKYIRITDIDDESHKFNTVDLVSPNAELEDKYLVNDGDILFARTGASTGKSYLYDKSNGVLYFAGFLIRVHILKDNPFFIYAQTLSSKYQNWLKKMSMRSGQPGINAEEYKNLPILVPPLPEQNAIAEILSAADKELNLLKQQLENYKKQKQGLMQKLLTGQWRVK